MRIVFCKPSFVNLSGALKRGRWEMAPSGDGALSRACSGYGKLLVAKRLLLDLQTFIFQRASSSESGFGDGGKIAWHERVTKI